MLKADIEFFEDFLQRGVAGFFLPAGLPDFFGLAVFAQLPERRAEVCADFGVFVLLVGLGEEGLGFLVFAVLVVCPAHAVGDLGVVGFFLVGGVDEREGFGQVGFAHVQQVVAEGVLPLRAVGVVDEIGAEIGGGFFRLPQFVGIQQPALVDER